MCAQRWLRTSCFWQKGEVGRGHLAPHGSRQGDLLGFDDGDLGASRAETWSNPGGLCGGGVEVGRLWRVSAQRWRTWVSVWVRPWEPGVPLGRGWSLSGVCTQLGCGPIASKHQPRETGSELEHPGSLPGLPHSRSAHALSGLCGVTGRSHPATGWGAEGLTQPSPSCCSVPCPSR